MKKWNILKSWLCGGCVYFTVLALVITLANLMLGGGQSFGIRATSFLLLFPAGLCMSVGGMLLRTQKLPRWSRYLLHYFITVLSIYLFLYLPSGVSAKPVNLMLMFVLLSVLYWVLFGLIMLIVSRVRKLMEEE
jgi:hypothetical protein